MNIKLQFPILIDTNYTKYIQIRSKKTYNIHLKQYNLMHIEIYLQL